MLKQLRFVLHDVTVLYTLAVVIPSLFSLFHFFLPSFLSHPPPVPPSQVAVGTPSFMAPELLRGETLPTRESDIYAFGILICESAMPKVI